MESVGVKLSSPFVLEVLLPFLVPSCPTRGWFTPSFSLCSHMLWWVRFSLQGTTLSDFSNGVILCDLVSALDHVKIPGVSRNPKSSASALHNIRKALEILQKKKVRNSWWLKSNHSISSRLLKFPPPCRAFLHLHASRRACHWTFCGQRRTFMLVIPT